MVANLNALNLHNGFMSDVQVPQSLCFAFPLSLSSKRTTSQILKEIKRALDNRSQELAYEHSENLFRLENAEVQMEMEVRQGIGESGVVIRKVAGDTIHYNRLCKELLACMNL